MSDSAVEYHPVAKTDELDEEEVMEVRIGDKDLALELEDKGYSWLEDEVRAAAV